VLPISEGIVKTQGNLNLAWVITWQHDTCEPRGHHEWQQFTMTIKESSWAHLTLVPSSTCMPWRTHRGWPEHYPNVHLWSMVGCHPTQRPLKLLSLRDRKKSQMRQYTTQTCSPGPEDRSFINLGRDYHLGAPNLRSRPVSTFLSSIHHFSLVAPPGVQLF
jgi:hypothetical protein